MAWSSPEQIYWTDRLRQTGFLTEAVAAIQALASEYHITLTAEPWEIAKAIGLMEEGER